MVLARFDTTGRFVAAGLRDGRAWLWDLETQAVVRHFEGHVKMVTGLSYVGFALSEGDSQLGFPQDGHEILVFSSPLRGIGTSSSGI
jgi:hypothetical protein